MRNWNRTSQLALFDPLDGVLTDDEQDDDGVSKTRDAVGERISLAFRVKPFESNDSNV